MLKVSVLKLLAVANLYYQLNFYNQNHFANSRSAMPWLTYIGQKRKWLVQIVCRKRGHRIWIVDTGSGHRITKGM